MRTHFALGAQLYRTGHEGQLIIRTARSRTAQSGDSLRMRRAWYAGEIFSGDGQGASTPSPNPAPSPTPAPASTPASVTPPAADKDEPKEGTPEWVKSNPDGAYKEIQRLRDKDAKDRIDSREFERVKAALDKFERAEKEAGEKKLRDDGELDKLLKQREQERDEAIRKAQEADLRATRVTIAAEFKLTPTQAKRLQGATEEELRKDAEELVKEFGLDKLQTQQPPPAETPKKQTQTTVAPGGQTVGETDAEHLARLRKPYQESPLFKPPGG